jgi:4-amino-4-deoxy-L-arabinose transferase-like glycosyltransferase
MPELDAAQRRQLLWLFGLALLVLAAGLGLREPWPSDEPRFVLVARQMVEGGDWWFPHRGHELYPDKPPLYFWILAAAHALTGEWRVSFLLPSLLAGLGVLWLVYDLGRRLWDHRAGLAGAIAVLCCLQFVYQFKRAQIDPTLVFATTLSLYGLLRHVLLGPQWRWYFIGCAAAGAGVVLKGVGFLPLLVLLPAALMRRRGWQGLATIPRARLHWALGALAFLAPLLAWLVPMVTLALADGDPAHRAYLDNLLFKQTATRYAEAWHHHKPAWYFVAVIAVFWLPFSLAFGWLWRDWRDAWRGRDARSWLPLAWALLVLVFFSASPGKRDMYILPMLPAVAWAAAPYLTRVAATAGFRRTLWAFALIGSVVLGGVGLAAMQTPAPRFVESLVADRGLGPEAVALWWMLLAVGGIGLLAAAWWRPPHAFRPTAVLLVALWCGYGFVVHPVLDPSSSARRLMVRARAEAGPDIAIGLVQWKEQNLLQSIGPVEEFGYRQPAAEQMRRGAAWLARDPARRLLLFSQPRAKPTCFAPGDVDGGRVRRVGSANRRDWFLVSHAGLAARCFEQGLDAPD